jgi:hypothetical protein
MRFIGRLHADRASVLNRQTLQFSLHVARCAAQRAAKPDNRGNPPPNRMVAASGGIPTWEQNERLKADPVYLGREYSCSDQKQESPMTHFKCADVGLLALYTVASALAQVPVSNVSPAYVSGTIARHCSAASTAPDTTRPMLPPA